MMRWLARALATVVCAVALGSLLPAPALAIPGFPDCKEAPTPETPGRGIAGFFAGTPDKLPPAADPFAEDSTTTIYEQYGYAGLRWNTYDLGCGPDAMRHPDAVIGTSISNWLVQMPIALTALTGSVTEAAFEPDFLGGFDGAVEGISSALHENFFASWIPFVIAAIGVLVIFKARSASMATSAAAVGWALIVVLIATVLFRWPVEAGRAADATVTSTLGAAVSELDGNGTDVDPGTAVASSVNESILYRAWLAGTFGSPDSKTAKKYGPHMFHAHALTWHEAAVLERDPEAGKAIIEEKQETWTQLAEQIKEEDPEAYEHLTGVRSETRVGYAILSTLGAFLALPFLLMSALLLVGCFLIVRLAVMLFPAFATLGAFPASRGLVTGLGRTVGAAVVNATIFGIGAGVTIAVLGVLFHPGGGSPAWLGLVLMPLFSAIMWVALKPFRRLTTMVSPNDSFIGRYDRPRWVKRAALAGLSAATSGAAAGVVASAMAEDDDDSTEVPERAEARPTIDVRERTLPASPLSGGRHRGHALAVAPVSPTIDDEPPAAPSSPPGGPGGSPRHRGHDTSPSSEAPTAVEAGFVPQPVEENLAPAEREEFDGDEVFVIYRPADDAAASA